MGKKKEDDETAAERPDEKKLDVSKDASIDFPVEVEALDADPYHETGTKFQAGEKKAKELVKRGWVKMAAILLFMFAGLGVLQAQTSVLAPFYNATNTYTLARLLAATAVRDTITDAGTALLTTKPVGGPGTVTVQVNVIKVSGTVAGTITLLGSLDGLTFKAIPTRETQTSVTTITAANATGTYLIRLPDSPCKYYQISWSGGTTMVAYLEAIVMKH